MSEQQKAAAEALAHAEALQAWLEKSGEWRPCLRDDLGDLIGDLRDELPNAADEEWKMP